MAATKTPRYRKSGPKGGKVSVYIPGTTYLWLLGYLARTGLSLSGTVTDGLELLRQQVDKATSEEAAK